MERILIYKDGEVGLEREELERIPEFSALLSLNYNKQKGDNDGRRRHRALAEFTYMWFMNSWASPYREYDEHERRTEALAAARLDTNYEFSTEYKLAEKKYLALIETRILKLIRSAEKAVDKLRDYLETLDFTITNASGALVNKPSEVIKVIKELDQVSEGLESLANRQKKEKQEFASTRGAQEVGWMMEREKFSQLKPIKNGQTSNGDSEGEED